MKLNPLERITIMGMLPAKSSIDKIRLVSEMKQVIGFSAQEIEEWEIKNYGDRIEWNADRAQEIDIEIPRPFASMIASLLEALNEKDPPEITEAHVSLWDKFVEQPL